MTINEFVKLPIEIARNRFSLGKDSRDWKISYAQKDVLDTNADPKRIIPITYRPFDIRYTYYTGKSAGFHCMPRNEVMQNMVGKENLAIISLRRPRGSEDWAFIFVGTGVIDKTNISSLDNASVLPLYLYTTPEQTAGTLFAQSETTRRPNLAPALIDAFSQKLKLQFIPDGQGDLKTTYGPEDVFYYAYAVFHSPTYRSRYAEFLKIDFPRLPLTGDKKLFAKLVALGKELVEFHLLKTPKVDNFITTYPVPGGGLVDKVKYDAGKVWINDEQYFGGVPAEVWNFKIGGYQVCDKWLKDRKGRLLSGEDVTHYQRVVVALKETIRLMSEVDRAIPNWPME